MTSVIRVGHDLATKYSFLPIAVASIMERVEVNEDEERFGGEC